MQKGRLSAKGRVGLNMRLLIPILLLCAISVGAQCMIPANIHISSPDPCATLARLQEGWEDAEKLMWYSMYAVDPVNSEAERFPFYRHALDSLPPFEVREYPGEMFYDGCGFWAGKFTVNVPYLPIIEWARDSSLRPWLHESGHLRWYLDQNYPGWTWANLPTAWAFVQHGVPEDPFVIALKRVKAVLFWDIPESHPYYPQAESGAIEGCGLSPTGEKVVLRQRLGQPPSAAQQGLGLKER